MLTESPREIIYKESDIDPDDDRTMVVGSNLHEVGFRDRLPMHLREGLAEVEAEGVFQAKREYDLRAIYPDLAGSEIAQRWFKRYPANEVHKRVAEYWDWSTDLPFPKFDVRCFICGSDETILKRWTWNDIPNSRGRTVRHHCDVFFGCLRCSNHWVHGVPCPPNVAPFPHSSVLLYHRDFYN